jgi:uncharacterized protein YbbK (DUF523 family)
MYLVSACLAGAPCRYDGKSKGIQQIIDLVNRGEAVPVCPEQLGGLTTPRASSEICGDKVMNNKGRDCTMEFELGAERTLAIAKALGIPKAILKANSPSCGCGKIYDGTFFGTLIDGNGRTAELLTKHGIKVYTENDLPQLDHTDCSV